MAYVMPAACPDPFTSLLDFLGWRRVAPEKRNQGPSVVLRWSKLPTGDEGAPFIGPVWYGQGNEGVAGHWFDLAAREGRLAVGEYILVETNARPLGLLRAKTRIVEERTVSLPAAS